MSLSLADTSMVVHIFCCRYIRGWENKTPANQTWGEAKLYFIKIYKSKKKFNKERATRTGGYESANSLASGTHNTYVTVVSNKSSKPPTNITNEKMSPSDQQTMIEYTNSLESELDKAREHAALITTTQETLLKRLEEQQKTMLVQQNKFMAMMTKTDKERRQQNNLPR